MRTLLALLASLLLVAPAAAENFQMRATAIDLPASTTAQFVPMDGAFAATTTVGASAGTNAGFVATRPMILWRIDCAEDVSHGGAYNRVYTVQSCATSACTPSDLSPSLTCTTSNSCTVPSCTCSSTLANGTLVAAGNRLVLKSVASSNSIAASNATCEVAFTYQ